MSLENYAVCEDTLKKIKSRVTNIHSMASVINKGLSGKADFEISKQDAVNFSETILDDCKSLDNKITFLNELLVNL